MKIEETSHDHINEKFFSSRLQDTGKKYIISTVPQRRNEFGSPQPVRWNRFDDARSKDREDIANLLWMVNLKILRFFVFVFVKWYWANAWKKPLNFFYKNERTEALGNELEGINLTNAVN